LEDLRTIAIASGALPTDAEMTPELLEYTMTLVEHCACLADTYKDQDGSAGDEIRAAFGLG
jgi:hypothetical protein